MKSAISEARSLMVEDQIRARGVKDPRVLDAMRETPRERFVPSRLADLAYEDAPLPIEEGQTISQPYIVGLMLEAARIKPTDRVLEIGAGSGYASAVISLLAKEVLAIERFPSLVALAQARLEAINCRNVTVQQGDGTLGAADRAPFDAIIVSAGAPEVPPSLLAQLALGGRLVIPVGHDARAQELVVIEKTDEHRFDRRSLGHVQFVPLIGTEGWASEGAVVGIRRAAPEVRLGKRDRAKIARTIADACEPFGDLRHAPLDALLARIGHARVVLIGESTHGTSEFYRLRARITAALVARAGFKVIGIEADWPDTAAIDRMVRKRPASPLREPMYARFPTWMWRNIEMQEFVSWLARRNETLEPSKRAGIHGLDVYGLNNSIGAVIDFLARVDPFAAEQARERYSCFSPWEQDPATWGRAAAVGLTPTCEHEAVATLKSLLEERLRYSREDVDAFFDAARAATVVGEAEKYYRAMYRSSRESWNLRDRHMFETLLALLEHRGSETRAVIWAHNSHVGNAAATEMGTHGEINLGQLVRERFGNQAYLIGFGTDQGTVAAASNWDAPMEVKTVRPSHEDSYERIMHEACRLLPAPSNSFFLPLRSAHAPALRAELMHPRLERAIGVVYRPETELVSHYFEANLPAQFDEYIWIDQTTALEPTALPPTGEYEIEFPTPAGRTPAGRTPAGMESIPDTYPFGL
jgi:protein-L-isoaspartate(D-aspartate) O-methyltransferase